jgi:4-oxalocrotonate tautomerase
MPILNVKVSARKSPEMTARISTILLELTTRVLGKDPRVTSIAIDYVDPDDWTIGGQSLSDQGRAVSTLTSRSPTKPTRKLRRQNYISETFSAFATLLGDLHEESYIYIQDVRATAYGYGGETQEHRYHHA